MNTGRFLIKALAYFAGYSGRNTIFEMNIKATQCGFKKTSVSVRTWIVTFFYYIQISCWVYRPELQWQFRLFRKLN